LAWHSRSCFRAEKRRRFWESVVEAGLATLDKLQSSAPLDQQTLQAAGGQLP
jgi:hypothetical protein